MDFKFFYSKRFDHGLIKESGKCSRGNPEKLNALISIGYIVEDFVLVEFNLRGIFSVSMYKNYP